MKYSIMQTIGEIRLANLEVLVQEHGTLEAVAALAGSSSVYLSQIRNGAPDQATGRRRQMGSAMARRIEAGCNKPEGWMDAPHWPAIERETDSAALSIRSVVEHLAKLAVAQRPTLRKNLGNLLVELVENPEDETLIEQTITDIERFFGKPMEALPANKR